MTKEQQDLAWQYLPKEARNHILNDYEYYLNRYEEVKANTSKGAIDALENIFGTHNLTSDKDPTELLFVEREKVVEKFNEVTKDYAETGDKWCCGYIRALSDFFGDKCLPDKATCKDNLQVEEPSVQGEPKFKVGKLIMSEGKVGRVLEYDSVREFPYLIHFPFNNSKDYRLESDLEPYTEPKFKVGDKVRFISQNHEIGEIAAYWPDEKFCYSVRFGKEYHNMAEHQLEPYTFPEPFNIGDKVIVKGTTQIGVIKYPYSNDVGYRVYFEDGDGGWDKEYSANELEPYSEPKYMVGDKVVIATKPYDIWWDGIVKIIKNIELNGDGIYIYSFYDYNYSVEEYDLHPYTEPETKDNMEKELNLCELLKDCEGETVFLVDEGEKIIDTVTDEEIIFRDKNTIGTIHFEGESLLIQPTGFAYAYPSKEAFLAHPLEARKVWQEWKSERTPKRWRAKEGEIYWLIPTDGSPIVSNTEHFTKYQNKLYEFGNYFRTKEEAQQAAKAIRECLKGFQEQNTKK